MNKPVCNEKFSKEFHGAVASGFVGAGPFPLGEMTIARGRVSVVVAEQVLGLPDQTLMVCAAPYRDLAREQLVASGAAFLEMVMNHFIQPDGVAPTSEDLAIAAVPFRAALAAAGAA